VRKRSKTHRKRTRPAPRAGSDAGRGFRYQDKYGAYLAVRAFLGLDAIQEIIPEGRDDFELRTEDGAILIDTKANRPDARLRAPSENAAALKALWQRQDLPGYPVTAYRLVLERVEDSTVNPVTELSAEAFGLGSLLGNDPKAARCSIQLAPNPAANARTALTDQLGIAPLTADIVVTALAQDIGRLSDDNGPRSIKERIGLTKGDITGIVDRIRLGFEHGGAAALIRSGAIRSVDFSAPLSDPGFFAGVDVRPGHFASGLAIHQADQVEAVLKKLKHTNATLIHGPSGAGKSGLMWDVANRTRTHRTWFEIQSRGAVDSAALTAFLNAYSGLGPIGFVIDDVGRGRTSALDQLLSLHVGDRDVCILGSVRTEDVPLIPQRHSISFHRTNPGERLGETIWQKLKKAGETDWAGWREPWERSKGLLLEYAHILTEGDRLDRVINDQIDIRLRDGTRDDELAILSYTAPAAANDGAVALSTLRQILEISDGDLARALPRLLDEHLIRLDNAGKIITGLHALRAEAICSALDDTGFASHQDQAQRAIAVTTPTTIEPLTARLILLDKLNATQMAEALANRDKGAIKASELASAIRGWQQGHLQRIADQWLSNAQQSGLSPKLATIAAMLGLVDGASFQSLPQLALLQSHGADLMARSRALQPPPALVDALISALETADTDIEAPDVVDALSALIGMTLPETSLERLSGIQLNLVNRPIHETVTLLDAAMSVSPDIASAWVESAAATGASERLLSRLSEATPFALPISLREDGDETVVEGSLYEAAVPIEESANELLCDYVHAMLMLAPHADIGHCRLVNATLENARPLDSEKRMPRQNSPCMLGVAQNRKIVDAIARTVGADNWSDYLSRGAGLLDQILSHFTSILNGFLVGRIDDHAIDHLNELYAQTDTLIAPSEAASEDDATEAISGRHLTPLQNLANRLNGQLIKQIAQLPGDALRLAAHVADTAELASKATQEPWKLIGERPPKSLKQARELLEDIEIVALEAAASGLNPRQRWIKPGAKSRGAFAHIANSARRALQMRVQKRVSELNSTFKAEVMEVQVIPPLVEDGIDWPQRFIALIPINTPEAFDAWLEDPKSRFTFLDTSLGPNENIWLIPVLKGKAAPDFAARFRETPGFASLLSPDLAGVQILGVVDETLLKRIKIPLLKQDIFLPDLFNALRTMGMIALNLGHNGRPEEEKNALDNAIAHLETALPALKGLASATGDQTLSRLAELLNLTIHSDADGDADWSGLNPQDLQLAVARAAWLTTAA
jgi:hypothetical protein